MFVIMLALVACSAKSTLRLGFRPRFHNPRGFLQFLDCLFFPTFLLERHSQALMSLGKVRLNLYGPAKEVNCSVQLTLRSQDPAQIVIGLCIIRFNPQGILQVRRSFPKTPLKSESVT